MTIHQHDPGGTAAPINVKAVLAHFVTKPRQARRFVLDLAKALIDEKDILDGDPDLEEGGDTEPNCGSGGLTGSHNDECEVVSEDEGACIQSQPHDAEEDADCEDLGGEASLGSLDSHVDQTQWGIESTLPNGSLDLEAVDEDGCDMQGSDNGIADSGGVSDQWGHSHNVMAYV